MNFDDNKIHLVGWFRWLLDWKVLANINPFLTNDIYFVLWAKRIKSPEKEK